MTSHRHRQAILYSTSSHYSGLFEQANHIPGLESLILLGLTTALPGLSNAALGFLTSAITGLVTTAIVTGINYMMMPKPPKPADGKAPKQQQIPPRIFGAGRNRIAGYLMLWESKSNNLLLVSAILAHPAHGIAAYYLNDDLVTLETISGATYVDDLGPDNRYGDGLIRFEHRLGAVPETPYPVHVNLLSAEGVWTNDHRGDGQTSIALSCNTPDPEVYPERYPYGAPSPSVVVDCARVWDFRDEDQDPEDPTTWTFSRNSALILVWWLCFCEFGPQWDYAKAIVPRMARWVEEADICDEPVALNGGGTEPRYECNFWATTETDPIAVTNMILASMDGHLVELGDGSAILTVGKFREELVEVITDDDLVGFTIDSDVPEEDEINRLVPRFTYPDTDYSDAYTDFFESVPDQLKIGRVLSQEGAFQAVHRWRQARRLGIREWRRIQQKKSGTLELRLSAINSIYARWSRIESQYMMPMLNNRVVENRRAVLALMNGGFQMQWTLHPDNIDAWNPATDEGAQPPVPPAPAPVAFAAPVISNVAAIGNGSTVYLRVTLVEPTDSSYRPVVSYRIKDIGGGNPGQWVTDQYPGIPAAGGFIVVDTKPVPTNEILEVRAQWGGVRGGLTTPSAPLVEVTTTLDTVPPDDLVSFTASGSEFLGHAPLQFQTPNDARIGSVAIYRVATGGALDTSNPAQFVDRVYIAPNQLVNYADGDTTRTNILTNPDFASGGTDWTTSGAGITFGSGVASHAAGANAFIRQDHAMANATSWRTKIDIKTFSGGGDIRLFLHDGTNGNQGTVRTSTGIFLNTITTTADRTQFRVRWDSATVADIDDLVLYQETVDCAPAGVWDYYAVPENRSLVEGDAAGPLTIRVV